MARRYIFRHAGLGLLLFSCATAYGAVAIFSEIGTLFPEARIIPAIALVLGVGYIWLWVRRYHDIVRVCQSKEGWNASVRLDDDALTIQWPDCSASLRWSMIREIWQFPDVIFLFTEDSRNWYMFLPTLPMSRQQRTFIEAKVIEHGGRVA